MRPPSHSGYVLPTVLVLIAIASLVSLTAMEGVAALQQLAEQSSQATRFRAAAMTAEARTVFLLATEPLGPDRVRVGGVRMSLLDAFGPGASEGTAAGAEVEPLALDGRAYRFSAAGGPVIVRAQDTAGLLNLNIAREPQLSALLQSQGMDEGDADQLAARLGDFVDRDNLRRARGAEEREYRGEGLPAPTNGPLRRPEQLLSVLGARDALSPADFRRLWPFVTSEPDSSAFNINTAPAEVLAARFGLPPALTERAIERRREGSYNSLDDLERVVGVALADDPTITYTFPNGRFRLIVEAAEGELSYSSVIVLTPEAADRPFVVESERLSHAEPITGTATEAFEDLPALPEPSRPAAGQ